MSSGVGYFRIGVEFPLPEKRTRFGLLPDPKITISIRTQNGYFPYRFLLDTGADVSMVPFSMAEDLGIDLSRCPTDECSGIEGRPLLVYHTTIAVRVGHVDLSLPCLISESDSTPFLLGRAGLFARFDIGFDNQRKRIVLSEI